MKTDKPHAHILTANNKLKVIQKRLALAVTYLQLVNRVTKNEIFDKTGINFYLITNGTRPVSLLTIVKLELVFGIEATSTLLHNAWDGQEEWNEETLAMRIDSEQKKWDKEKELLRQKTGSGQKKK